VQFCISDAVVICKLYLCWTRCLQVVKKLNKLLKPYQLVVRPSTDSQSSISAGRWRLQHTCVPPVAVPGERTHQTGRQDWPTQELVCFLQDIEGGNFCKDDAQRAGVMAAAQQLELAESS
jgi:hypothetical protein